MFFFFYGAFIFFWLFVFTCFFKLFYTNELILLEYFRLPSYFPKNKKITIKKTN